MTHLIIPHQDTPRELNSPGAWWWGGYSGRRKGMWKREKKDIKDRPNDWRDTELSLRHPLRILGLLSSGRECFHPHCSGNSIIQFIPQWSYRVCHGYLRHHSPVLSAVNDESPIHSSIQATWDFLYTIFWFLSKKKNHPSHIQASQEMVHHSRAHIYCSVKNSSSGSPPET